MGYSPQGRYSPWDTTEVTDTHTHTHNLNIPRVHSCLCEARPTRPAAGLCPTVICQIKQTCLAVSKQEIHAYIR